MKPKRKRRWLLGVVAVGAGVAGFVFFREYPKDVPRLVVLRQEQVDGQKVVVFRFDAPKHRGAMFAAAIQNPSTWNEGLMEPADGIAPGYVKAGQSTEFRIPAPRYDVWRLCCAVAYEKPVPTAVLERVMLCWRRKSFAPLRWHTFSSEFYVQSEPITNALPKTADAPAK